MKLPSAVALAFFLGSLALPAQSTQPQGAQTVVMPPASFGVAGMEGLNPQSAETLKMQREVSTCPISMSAQHLPFGNMVKTGESEPMGIGQKLNLTLSSPDSRQVASAVIMIRGWTRGRLTQAAPGQAALSKADSGDAEKTLTVTFPANTGNTVSADIWAPGFTAVDAIEFESIGYRDGSSWKPESGASCTVAPNPFMPITSR